MSAHVGSTVIPHVTFVGPYGVGKTTAVRTVSDRPLVQTESPSTLAGVGEDLAKLTTTTGLELGEWHGHYGTVRVVGTPGQVRFDAIRRSAIQRSTAVVLWVYGHQAEAVENYHHWRDLVAAESVPADRLTIAVTRLTSPRTATRIVEGLSALAQVPVVAADPRDRADVETVLTTALDRVTPRRNR